jgi:hypothetical protein
MKYAIFAENQIGFDEISALINPEGIGRQGVFGKITGGTSVRNQQRGTAI